MSKTLQDLFDEDLLLKRQIYLEGSIDFETADKIGKLLLWLNAKDEEKEVFLYINSFGGSVVASLRIYDAVKNSSAPVVGIVLQRGNSMASVILQACKIRKAMVHCELELHTLRLELKEDWDKFLTKSRKELTEINEYQKEIWHIIAERSGQSFGVIRRLHLERKILSAKQAKELGLVDEVI